MTYVLIDKQGNERAFNKPVDPMNFKGGVILPQGSIELLYGSKLTHSDGCKALK